MESIVTIEGTVLKSSSWHRFLAATGFQHREQKQKQVFRRSEASDVNSLFSKIPPAASAVGTKTNTL